MARPRVFLSSTFYDLKQVRADLRIFIENLGYTTVDNNQGDIPYGKEDELDKYCYKEINNIDILVSVIGGRFGSESSYENNSSISQAELKTAINANKQVYIFIEKNVLAEYETYLLNKDNSDIRYKYIDDIRIYKFIEEIKGLKINNNIAPFETTSDIIKYLKEQFAGLFQTLLENQTRVKEINLIQDLEKTANNLNNLVNYLVETNQGKDAEINSVLMIQHPLIDALKTYLKIKYNFYIIDFDDLNELLEARGFNRNIGYCDIEYDCWVKMNSNDEYQLLINISIFDENKKLKFYRKNEWKKYFVKFEIHNKNILDNDDLPF